MGKYINYLILLGLLYFLYMYESSLIVREDVFDTGIKMGLYEIVAITSLVTIIGFFRVKLLNETSIALGIFSIYTIITSLLFNELNGAVILPITTLCFSIYMNKQISSRVFIYVFIGLFVLLYKDFLLHGQEYMLSDMLRSVSSNYALLYLLPFILLLESKPLKIILSVAVFISMLLVLKRAGIIGFLLAIAIYLLVESKLTFNIKRITVFVLVSFVLVYVFSYFNTLLDNSLSERFTEEEGGRFSIYATVIHQFAKSDIVSIIFGHGWDSVTKIPLMDGRSAHNDFLEILYDFGIIAFFLYIWFVIKLIKTTINNVKKKSRISGALAASTTLFIFVSCVSHVFLYPRYMLLFCLFWGIIYSNNLGLKTVNALTKIKK